MGTRTSLERLVADAREHARNSARGVLASRVERISDVDPLDAMETLTRLAATDGQIARSMESRMYWTRPVDDFSLAGIGAAITLAPEGADRFATIDRDWTTLSADAVVDDVSAGESGAGPALMGGFAFDPEGPRSRAWRDFSAARLFVPRLQIVRRGTSCWMTLNVFVTPTEPADDDIDLALRLRSAFLESTPSGRASAASPDASSLELSDVRRACDWRETVTEAVAAIDSGSLEKVVLAREVRIDAPHEFNVIAALRQLRTVHRNSYVFGCWHDRSVFVGATPERLVRVDGSAVQASSLAGSVSRGATTEADASQAATLLLSTKDRAEHEIVRRALCAGLGRLCDDVAAPAEPTLLTLPHVHHLHTAVRATLRPGHTLLQLVAQLHPTPAVGGEPRNAALRFIREHEKMDRGWYAAPVGWLQRDRGEFAVGLRSALVTGSTALLFAGCGIVADSDPAREYAESLLKLRPMEQALAAALPGALPATSDDPDVEPRAIATTGAPAECRSGTR